VLVGCGSQNAWDGYAQLRLIEGGDILQTFTNEWILGVTSVALSADETQVLTGHGYGMGEWGWGEANLWDVASGSLVLTLMDVDNSRVNSVGFSPDGTQLLVTGRSLESFDRTTGEQVGTLKLRDAAGSSWPESYAAVSTDGTEVLFATTYRFMGQVVFQCANLADPDTGYLVCGLPWGGPPAVFSPDERLVLTGGASGVAALWDIRNAASLLQIRSAESGPEVTWKKGALQYAPTPEGAWQDLPAASPMPISPIGEQGFFRVRIADDPGN
jgi:WD40 repeat protein